MLSRTADNLYWLARYVERAEYLARILEVTQRLTTLPLAYVGSANEWESAGPPPARTTALSPAHSEGKQKGGPALFFFSSPPPSPFPPSFVDCRHQQPGGRP